MTTKAKFGGKIGLIAATVGSAVGLGNIWRFPAEAQANGGSAFLLVYVICVFILGIPMMVAEFSLGRGGHSDAIGVFKILSPKTKWWLTGLLAIVASYLILSFYMVVSGWTLEYMWESLTNNLYAEASDPSSFNTQMSEYTSTALRPLVFTFIMLVINIVILINGVQKGIEKLSNILMPLLFALLLAFILVSLSLPGAGAGLAYFLSPDFSKIDSSVALNALGQAFFSLSLGMGILVTYASYYPAKTKLPQTAATVSLLDMLVAVMMGIIIFPAVYSYGLTEQSMEGATLVFTTLPEVFSRMPFTQLWSTLFFMLLTLAALTSTISLAEVTIAMFQDRLNMSRRTACVVAIAPLFILSTLCSLSLSGIDWLNFSGKSLFDILDSVSTNIMLPIVALLTSIYLGWKAPKRLLGDEITNKGTCNRRISGCIIFCVRYVTPFLIAAVLLTYLLS